MHAVIIQIHWQLCLFVALVQVNFRLLAIDIAGVLGLNLQLLRHLDIGDGGPCAGLAQQGFIRDFRPA